MREVSLQNFRPFREKQTARLAPLTLLVGENSTGKTSFMALVRALSNLTHRHFVPTHRTSVFTDAPYDLGSFDEIAHHRGARGSHAETFQAGFEASTRGRRTRRDPIRFDFTFGRRKTGPSVTRAKVSCSGAYFELSADLDRRWSLYVGVDDRVWEWRSADGKADIPSNILDRSILFYVGQYLARFINPDDYRAMEGNYVPVEGSLEPTEEDRKKLTPIRNHLKQFIRSSILATAPVRSNPRRTYDPLPPKWDPEGAYVPMYLANLSFSDRNRWEQLKHSLEEFGKTSGLFDEIDVRHFGKKDSEPFQVQVRKGGPRLKGPRRNIIDMGYGVSQVLSVITELLKQNYHSIFLLQQPESSSSP